jgi:hypothetical protein
MSEKRVIRIRRWTAADGPMEIEWPTTGRLLGTYQVEFPEWPGVERLRFAINFTEPCAVEALEAELRQGEAALRQFFSTSLGVAIEPAGLNLTPIEVRSAR